MFAVRLGIYAAVSCMFSCVFCGRTENPSARYANADVEPGNALFDQVFQAMPKGTSSLSLGGGLEPLTNPKLDDVISSATSTSTATRPSRSVQARTATRSAPSRPRGRSKS